MIDGLSDWLRSVKESLGNVYDEARKVGSNFVEWCVDAPVVVSVLVGSTALLFGWLYLVSHSSNPKPWVRGAGVFLQLVGFVLAAYGLERTLEKFGRTPSTSRIPSWLRGFKKVFNTSPTWLEPEDLVYSMNLSDERSAEVERGIHPPQTMPERIRKLEQKLQDVERDLKALRGDLFEKIGGLEEEVEDKVEAVEEEVQEMREKIKEVNVGESALWLEWWGVSLFVYGVPLASFPSLFLPAYRVLAVPFVAGGLLGSLHWLAD